MGRGLAEQGLVKDFVLAKGHPAGTWSKWRAVISKLTGHNILMTGVRPSTLVSEIKLLLQETEEIPFEL